MLYVCGGVDFVGQTQKLDHRRSRIGADLRPSSKSHQCSSQDWPPPTLPKRCGAFLLGFGAISGIYSWCAISPPVVGAGRVGGSTGLCVLGGVGCDCVDAISESRLVQIDALARCQHMSTLMMFSPAGCAGLYPCGTAVVYSMTRERERERESTRESTLMFLRPFLFRGRRGPAASSTLLVWSICCAG